MTHPRWTPAGLVRAAMAAGAVTAGAETDRLIFRDGSVAQGQVMELRYGVYRFLDGDSGMSKWVARPELRFVIYGDTDRAARFLELGRAYAHCPHPQAAPVELLPAADFRRRAAEVVAGARTSVNVMTYRLSNPEQPPVSDVVNAVRAQARAGVTACLILPAPDPAPDASSPAEAWAAALRADGVELRLVDAGAIPHQKLLIVDERILCIGSSDLTPGGLDTHLEWNLVSEHPAVVREAVADFQAVHARSRPAGASAP